MSWYELKVAGYSVGMTQSLNEVVDWYHRGAHTDRIVYRIDGTEKRPIQVDSAPRGAGERPR